MVRNVPSILDLLRVEGPALRELGVRRLALFGSAAHGRMSDSSDLDILVEIQPKTFKVYMDTKEYLESRFGCSVDLVLFSALKPALRQRIIEDAIDVPLG